MTTATARPLTLITGHSRGVGAALAAQRLAQGHRVLGLSRHANTALSQQAQDAGWVLEQWAVDLADPLPVAERLAAWLAAQDAAAIPAVALINNAGVITPPGPLAGVPLAQAASALRAGLEATVLLCAAFLQATAGWAADRRVLNVSSGLGRRAMAGSAVYCAAKAGMDHLTRALALEQAGVPNPARLASIAPGVIDTDMQQQLRGADPATFAEQARFAALKAQGQLLTPEACARLLLARLDGARFGEEPVGDVRDAG